MRRLTLALLLLAACHSNHSGDAPPAHDQTTPAKAEAPAKAAAPATAADDDWWKSAVFYEIYPRSFQDSNGDGVGNLPGIISRLDYLADLGVDAIWLTPFFPSPQVDFGYDVADYRGVNPQFGTLADLDRLIAEAHKRHIRVIADLVLNHTSDQHRWFKDAVTSRTAAHRDFYVWKDPAPGGGPPNNWASCFERSGWTLSKPTGQYYYHGFYAAQPDLNWRNPEVEKAMFDTVAWWYRRGIDGFRLDAVNWLFEDAQLRDNPAPPTPQDGCATEAFQIFKYNRDQPEVHGVLQRLRTVTDGFPGRVLVGEAYVPLDDLVRYYGPKNDELQLPFNFSFMSVGRLDAAAFRAKLAAAEKALDGRPTTYVLDNHDNPRSYDRFGDGVHDNDIAKLMTTLLLTVRGSPFLYYGEELGMVTTVPRRKADVRDPIGKTFWPRKKGRDGERTPMQWDQTAHAGFTTGTPWLPMPGSAGARSVAVESKDPRSILSYTRQLLALRRANPALAHGDYQALGDDPHVLVYARHAGGQTAVVVLNMWAQPSTVTLDGQLRVLVGSAREPGPVKAPLILAPFEAVVLEKK